MPDGQFLIPGAGGTGSGIKGHANGRTFMGCPSPYAELHTPVTITVTVMIDAEDKVVSAKATVARPQPNARPAKKPP